MIYTCDSCGGWFDAAQLFDEKGERRQIATCQYCGRNKEISAMQTSAVTRGYDRLAAGEFSEAIGAFNQVLKKAKKPDPIYISAYLGRALADQSIQAIYEDEVADSSKPPIIICHGISQNYFSQDQDFLNACRCIDMIKDKALKAVEVNRLEGYRRKLDGIKKIYDDLERQRISYQLFIAFADNVTNTSEYYSVAQSIRNQMPSEINRTFMLRPLDTITDEDDKIRYEAEILYGIHHSESMMIVLGEDINDRLKNVYTRYFFAKPKGFHGDDRLCFVDLGHRSNIHLPGHIMASHIINYNTVDSVDKIADFICNLNGIMRVAKEKKTPVIDDPGPTPVELKPSADVGATAVPILESEGMWQFGSYPQRREYNEDIVAFFNQLPKPSAMNANGWTEMFKRKGTGRPYTWYRDETIDGKTYRAVYFKAFREVFTVRESDVTPDVQAKSKYQINGVHVFAFEPIEWYEINRNNSAQAVTLIASVGLDSREYNSASLSGTWMDSTLHAWLNEDFLRTAFTEEQQNAIFFVNNEKVMLVDADTDLVSPIKLKKIQNLNICASDYEKCIGGKSDRNLVSNFWVMSAASYCDRAMVLSPREDVSDLPSDCTTVSVVPKIIVRTDSM